jgi:broad specificity phosphatase PhoE
MKWPASITLVRHAESRYNELSRQKKTNPLYLSLQKAFAENRRSEGCKRLAQRFKEQFALGVGDYETSLTPRGMEQARSTGEKLRELIPLPQVIFYSSYYRTAQTLEEMEKGWPELNGVKQFADDRIREQEHGLALLYNDWLTFCTYHPEQKDLHELIGPYWYQFPQGESISQVRDRARAHTSMLIREYSDKHVLLITHHLTILSFRANYERLTPERFLRLDEEEKPLNCGVTLYQGNPAAGSSGKMELVFYNRQLL